MTGRNNHRQLASHSARSALFQLASLAFFYRADDEFIPFHEMHSAGTKVFINAWLLRPTQCVVGFREVIAKRKKLEKQSGKKRVSYLKKKNVPIVIGPGGAAWLVDGHHTLCGLLESEVANKTAYGRIIANWSDLSVSEFWKRMRANNYVYLKSPDGRSSISPARLPASLTQMTNDPWRSLAWAVGKEGGYEIKDEVFYQKFQWSEFFRAKIEWDDSSKKEFYRAVDKATVMAGMPSASHLPGWLDGALSEIDEESYADEPVALLEMGEAGLGSVVA